MSNLQTLESKALKVKELYDQRNKFDKSLSGLRGNIQSA